MPMSSSVASSKSDGREEKKVVSVRDDREQKVTKEWEIEWRFGQVGEKFRGGFRKDGGDKYGRPGSGHFLYCVRNKQIPIFPMH